MGAMTEMVAKQAEQKARGILTGSERMKIQILKDIVASPRTTPRAKADAMCWLQQWGKRAVASGHASLAAWLERR